MGNKRMLSVAVLAVSFMLVSASCANPKEQPTNAAATGKVVQTTAVKKLAWEDRSELAAEIVPFMELNVVVKADGDVVRVLKKRGDTVMKDEPILEIDKTDILREKEQVDAGLFTAREQLEKAKKDLADSKREIALSISKAELSISDLERDSGKLRNDYDKGIINKSQLLSMETRLDQARMDLDLLNDKKKTLETSNPLSQAEYQLRSAEITLENWERSMSYYDVKAPVTGILTYMPAEEGMALQRGVTIGKVQQQNPVKIKAQLTDALRLQAQDKTEISFTYPATGEAFTGKVIYLSTTADQQTKTYELELEVGNDQGALKPGSRVQLQFAEKSAQTLAVPADAVMQGGEGPYVYIANGDSSEKRAVTAGRIKEGIQEITKGLTGSEQVIISGQHRLKDGERIAVQN